MLSRPAHYHEDVPKSLISLHLTIRSADCVVYSMRVMGYSERPKLTPNFYAAVVAQAPVPWPTGKEPPLIDPDSEGPNPDDDRPDKCRVDETPEDETFRKEVFPNKGIAHSCRKDTDCQGPRTCDTLKGWCKGDAGETCCDVKKYPFLACGAPRAASPRREARAVRPRAATRRAAPRCCRACV